MKQTLISLLALAGLAAAEDVTFSSVAALSGYGGLDFNISQGSWLSISGGQWDYDTQHYGRLNSVSLYLIPAAYTQYNMSTGFGVGIYEKRGSGEDASWVFLGRTDWFAAGSDFFAGAHTFRMVDEVVLSVDKTYTMAFIAGSEYYDGLIPGSVRGGMDGATWWVGEQPLTSTEALAAIGLLREPGDATGTVLLYAAGDSGEVMGVTPYVAVNVTPFDTGNVNPLNVPEPTTATLSLLVLCGLAARRRRA